MIITRNTPAQGALARLILTLAACVACAFGPVPATAQHQSIVQLASYYQQMEQELVSQGHLRQERWTSGLDAATLARNFMAIAMRSEYSLRGGAATQGGGVAPLRRWEQPIRLGVHFGPSVSGAQQRRDLATVQSVAQRLHRASGHPIRVVNANPNFHVLVLNDEERANARAVLQQLAPGLSRAAQNAVLRMRPNTFCMVVAIPGANPADGYQQAIAIVRAEHPPLMRRSCIEEELAQGMGLANDSPDARPSIFNDDEEFGVLTRHDELLLRMLYHDSLRCGMSAGAVDQYVEALARTVLASG
jgi:hypothetical protein